ANHWLTKVSRASPTCNRHDEAYYSDGADPDRRPASSGQAQAKPEALTFEVASVKPSDPAARGVMIQFTPGGGLRTVNARVRQLVQVAYEVQTFQVSGGPGWIETEGFDILAKPAHEAESDPGSSRLTDQQRDQARQRLQNLLAERFHLSIRHEPKE